MASPTAHAEATPHEAPPAGQSNRLRRTLFSRELPHYPPTSKRLWYLFVVIAATVLLYYQLYIQGAVGPSILQHYGMSFKYYVYISVVGNVFGALASVVAGIADRVGRANIIAWGLGVTSVLDGFVLPHMPNKWAFAVVVAAVSAVEGLILVATPALVRDFSPQLGRASAMGFWTLGPVLGSLCVSAVSSSTLDHLHAWQDQFVIAGVVGLVVFVVAVVGLRELNPGLRDQLMVSAHDRALVEARAKGIDVEAGLRRPWKQMLTPRLVLSSLAISLFMLYYVTAVGFFVLYFTSTFGFSEHKANSLGNWYWGFNALSLVLVGIASDRLRVRKPFMLVGALGALVMTALFATRTTHPDTSYNTFVLIITLNAIFQGLVLAPWMAAYTEDVEDRNPALMATGIAVWGLTFRLTACVATFLLPIVITATTPLTNYGARVQAISTKYANELATASAIKPDTLATLTANPNNTAAGIEAVNEVSQKFHITPAQAIARMQKLAAVPKADMAYLQAHGPELQAAVTRNPHEWRRWWWGVFGSMVVFLPLLTVMGGFWSPAAARRRAQEHERAVQAELKRIEATG